MKKYEEYKNSGVEWIGEIPEGWNLSKLKYVSLLNPSNKKPLVDDAEIGYMPMECLRYGRIEKRSAKLSELSTGLNYFEDGDLVMAKVTPCFENGNIAIAENLTNGCALGSSEVFVFRTKEIETKWLFYIMRHESLIKELASTMSGVGGLKRIDSEYMMNCSIPMPSLKEREGIISYLDSHCSKIDEMIEAKAKQIDDLKEYRKSLISEVVTKGLNPDVEMKESGVGWIGSIPNHWKVNKLQHVLNLRSGESLQSESIKEEGKYPVFGGNGVRGYYSEFTNEGDFVLIGRQGALCGNINYAHGKFWATEHAVVCYPKTNVALFWLGELLRTMNLNQYSIASAQPGLAVERIKKLQMPVPPLSEQQAIAAYLDDKCTKIADLMKLLDDEIKELQKYKTSIISEAVTGKIKVC